MKNIFLLSALLALPAGAVEGTNLVSNTWCDEVQRRLHGSAEIDYRNGFTLRGIVLSSTSCSVQTGNLSWDGGIWGRFGGTAMAVDSLDMTGCPIADRQWFTVALYNVYYGRRLQIVEDWSLDAQVFRNWLTFIGCIGDIPTLVHWGGYLGLNNPYVTPYCFYRWADQGQNWTYWNLGFRRRFCPLDKLSLTPVVFFDLGDGRHLRTQYKFNPNSADGSFSPGLMAMNLMLSAEYALTKWMSLTAFIQEFITLNGDGRDALDRLLTKNTVKEMTIFGVGLKFSF